MKLQALPVFKSATPLEKDRPSHFCDPEKIQSSLKKVCDAWVGYLQDYVDQTTELFGTPEFPWRGPERSMVSSLAAAVSRQFESSLALEECLVQKKRGQPARGRCDLWFSIPDRSHGGGRFNFYLEAKKSEFEGAPGELFDFLGDRSGVSRLIRDYKKEEKPEKPLEPPDFKVQKNQRSPYQNHKNRKHKHYVIGMLVTLLRATKDDSEKIQETLDRFFQNGQPIQLRWSGKKRVKVDLARWPTVAVTVLTDDNKAGMLAIFTALGSSDELLDQRAMARKLGN